MGSLNSSEVPVVSKQNVTFRRIGLTTTITSGLIPNGQLPSISTVPDYARASGDFGTQPDQTVSQYSVVEQASYHKATESINDTIVSRYKNTYAPTSTDQEEIANLPISQYGVSHTGNRLIVRDSDGDTTIAREGNDSVRPPQ